MQSVNLVNCPTCGREVAWKAENKYRPFCCERCKKIDLGAWASGSYVISQSDPSDSIFEDNHHRNNE